MSAKHFTAHELGPQQWVFAMVQDGHATPLGYCAEEVHHHERPELARACYAHYQLDKELWFLAMDHHPADGVPQCEHDGCENDAEFTAQIGGRVTVRCCEAHANVDSLRTHYTSAGDWVEW